MPFGLIIGAGVGILNQVLVQKPKEDAARQVAAAEARWSPWTGIKPQPVQTSNPLGGALAGAGQGAALSQGLQNSQAQAQYLANGGTPKVSFMSNLSSFGGSGGGFGSSNGMFGSSPWQSPLGVGGGQQYGTATYGLGGGGNF